MRRAPASALALSCLLALAVPAVALAKTRTAIDHLAGVRFTLHGRALTTRIVPQATRKPADARKQLLGHKLRASCGMNGANGKPVAKGVTFVSFTWPRGRLTHRVRLPRDISAKAGWCIVEAVASGSDVANVDFKLGHNPFE